MKKFLWILGAVVVIGGALVAVLLFGPKPNTQVASNTETVDTSEPASITAPESDSEMIAVPESESEAETMVDPVAPVARLEAGRYTDYSASAVSAGGYSETILFFHADWCPECRAFEQAIKAESIPNGVQILEVDYDSNQSLRQQYEVTLQTTFVKVNQSGERQSLWVGYGRDKSLGIILENT